MSAIREDIATVYHGGGRRWFKLGSACRAEAKAKFKEKYGRDYGIQDGMPIEETMRVITRLARIYAKRYRNALATSPEITRQGEKP